MANVVNRTFRRCHRVLVAAPERRSVGCLTAG